MSKIWDARTKAIFRKHPVKCTAMLAGYGIWIGLFVVLTVVAGGMLMLMNKDDAWIRWWQPW